MCLPKSDIGYTTLQYTGLYVNAHCTLQIADQPENIPSPPIHRCFVCELCLLHLYRFPSEQTSIGTCRALLQLIEVTLHDLGLPHLFKATGLVS